VLVGLLASSVLVRPANAHCQVPCGIYTDQLRFEQMLEDHKTIAKAITSIAELSDKADPQSVNQAVRWVMTKEDHASKAQGVIAEYFMTQRIKADDPEYARKLAAAHKVMTTAMACKQSTDPAAADAFREAILDFYRAYEGKEPVLEEG
jgi:nickel superoxide dismutase